MPQVTKRTCMCKPLVAAVTKHPFITTLIMLSGTLHYGCMMPVFLQQTCFHRVLVMHDYILGECESLPPLTLPHPTK